MLKQILIFSSIAVIMAAVGLAAFYLFQKKLIFFPQKLSEADRERFSRHAVEIKRGDVALRGWFVKGEISVEKPLLVYYGGNGEEVSGNLWDLKRFNKGGSFLFMNYRGYGDSQGEPSEKNIFEDALFILDHIAQKENIDLGNVVLMGRSLGAAVAVHAASRRKTKALILVSPFDSMPSVGKRHYPWLPVDYILTERFESIKRAPQIKTPALFIMGDRDRIVPMSHSMKLAESWGGPAKSVVIKGAAHNYISNYDDYWRAINAFLKSL